MIGYSLLDGLTTQSLVVIIAVFVVALIAFIIGFARGFRRTGWGAFVWALTAAGWLFFETKFSHLNPLAPSETDSSAFGGLKASLFSLCVFIAIAFLLFGILAGICRPKKKNYDTVIHQYYQHNEQKFVGTYEETEKYDDEEQEKEDKKRGGKGFKKPFKVKKNKPRFFNRLLGGVISLLNCALVVCGLAAVALVVLPVFGVKLDAVYDVSVVAKLKTLIEKHALDVLFAAVLMGMAYGGWRAGLLRGLRNLLQSIGTIVCIVGGFALPFLNIKFVLNMNDFFATGIGHFVKDDSLLESAVPVLGQLASGLLLAILSAIALALVCKLLQVLARNTRRSGPWRFVDGVCGIVTMTALGILLLAFIFVVLSMLEYFGLNLHLDAFASQESCLSGDFIEFIKTTTVDILDKFRGGTLIK